RGDLDWIVMKCLEKDRTRRYETANGLAMDLQRYLNNEPVVACPPTAAYRFRKMIRRNKLVFAAVSAVAAALLLGLRLSTWQWRKAAAAKARMAQVIDLFVKGQVARSVLPLEHKEVLLSQTNRIPYLVPPGDPRLNGRTYAQLAADFWKWNMEMPL